ncbi:MAG: insulinase family protein [Acidobacteriota bacterium]|nr:MAG: insulinase family protein [Acidobacteriota bacterium]
MALQIPRIAFSDHTLENGLRVILHENTRTPLAHLSIHYGIGSSYETAGLSGFAHLFEHMMFQGSENVRKNEHGQHIDRAGGRWNASTNKDRTNYFETVPAHFLDLALWLEADRMRSLSITEENFENQRQTVIEEKKQSYDNRPYGLAFLRFDQLAYSNWAYAHSIIGEVDDLRKATLSDALAFHKQYYGPGNAVLVLAGDIAEAEALKRVQTYFSAIPDRTSVQRPDLAEPQQGEEKIETMRDPLAILPALIIGYHMPPLGTPEHYALSLAALILSDGDSSRLYQRLVYENNWSTGLFAGPNQYRGPQLFRIWIEVQQGISPQLLLDAIDEELERIRQDGVSERELEKAQNQVAHRFVGRLARVSQVGEMLAQYTSYYGDPDKVNSELENYLSVTREDIQECVRSFLKNRNRTLIIVEPRGEER